MIVLALSLVLFRSGQAATVVANTQYGQVRGLDMRTTATVGSKERAQAFRFLGIPFAAPPVGALRFAETRPPTRWNTVRDTLAYQKMCVSGPQNNITKFQDHHYTNNAKASWLDGRRVESAPGRSGWSEDCLYLNVWRPAANPTGPNAGGYPVLVYIHGGGQFQGTANDGMADGTRLAEKGVVYVSINYRLGLFGQLAIRALKTSTGSTGGMNLLFDTQMALKWIKGSIANFGGNPNKTTIMGCSGGGTAVTQLMASPKSKGLFTNAIPQSGCPMQAAWAVWSENRGLAIGDALISNMGCTANTLTCLRGLPKKKIYEAWLHLVNHGKGQTTHNIHPTFGCLNCFGQNDWLMPSVDGKALTKTPQEYFENGEIPGIPANGAIVIGKYAVDGLAEPAYGCFLTHKNANYKDFPANASMSCAARPQTTKQFDATLKRAFPSADQAELKALYPLDPPGNPADIYSQMHGEAGGPTCQMTALANFADAFARRRVFEYVFAYHPDNTAGHCMDIVLYSGANPVMQGGGFDQGLRYNKPMFDQYQDYIISFLQQSGASQTAATEISPKTRGLPKWKPYTNGDKSYLFMGAAGQGMVVQPPRPFNWTITRTPTFEIRKNFREKECNYWIRKLYTERGLAEQAYFAQAKYPDEQEASRPAWMQASAMRLTTLKRGRYLFEKNTAPQTRDMWTSLSNRISRISGRAAASSRPGSSASRAARAETQQQRLLVTDGGAGSTSSSNLQGPLVALTVIIALVGFVFVLNLFGVPVKCFGGKTAAGGTNYTN